MRNTAGISGQLMTSVICYVYQTDVRLRTGLAGIVWLSCEMSQKSGIVLLSCEVSEDSWALCCCRVGRLRAGGVYDAAVVCGV